MLGSQMGVKLGGSQREFVVDEQNNVPLVLPGQRSEGKVKGGLVNILCILGMCPLEFLLKIVPVGWLCRGFMKCWDELATNKFTINL